jgi:hypothetical protein
VTERFFGRRPVFTVAWGNAPGILDAHLALAGAVLLVTNSYEGIGMGFCLVGAVTWGILTFAQPNPPK